MGCVSGCNFRFAGLWHIVYCDCGLFWFDRCVLVYLGLVCLYSWVLGFDFGGFGGYVSLPVCVVWCCVLFCVFRFGVVVVMVLWL